MCAATRTGSSSTPDQAPIELLAPAGGPPALQAALSAGADAVYVGLRRYSARAFAGNFSAEELLAAIDRAHLHGARLYLALNTLLKDDELDDALEALVEPYARGLDALIVADLGFAALVRERFPGLELHASTQAGTHSSAQLAALSRLGFGRAILARELSVDEIVALDPHGLDLEVFVHGALCYGYSGMCLLSSMVGGRSGNRGRCSQACRMRYDLRRAGDASALLEGRLLSTSDLTAIEALPRLAGAGVRSFKIEGRMKEVGYVATVTAVYREALDAATADPGSYVVRPEWRARLEQAFSRGFTDAHLRGAHEQVRSGGRGGHRGVGVGRVEAIDEPSGEVRVRFTAPVSSGDVLQVYTQRGSTDPVRLEAVLAGDVAGIGADGVATLRLREHVAVKDRILRLASGEADERAAALAAGRETLRPVDLGGRLRGRLGEPLRLRLEADGEAVDVVGARVLEPAQRAALDADRALSAVGALGGTPYRLERLDVEVDEGLFAPVSELKDLRRRALVELDERRLRRARRAAPAAGAATRKARSAADPAVARLRAEHPVGRPTVVLRMRPGERRPFLRDEAIVCLDLRVGDELADVREAFGRAAADGSAVRCRAPAVLFDADVGWWRAVSDLPWAAVYARHQLALTQPGSGVPVLLEYPLQGLNGRAAPLLGAAGLVCSPETSLDEVPQVVAAARDDGRPRVVEVLAFGREVVLQTRDRLGIAEGVVPDPLVETAPGVGRGVVRDDLLLVDRKGYEFPTVVTTTGSAIANARVTNIAAQVEALAAAGVDGFIVVTADLDRSELEAFAADGLDGLAERFSRARHTTGHLFRGVG